MAKKTAKKKPASRERLVEVEVETPDTIKMTKSRVKQCAFCKHYYINPCSDKSKDKCQNYLFLQSRANKGRK